MENLKEKIRAEALRLGFSFVGFSKPHQTPHFSKFEEWLHRGVPSNLDYLGKKYVQDGRSSPSSLLNNAGSVLTLGIAYKDRSAGDGSNLPRNKTKGYLASYACLPDYHKLLKQKANKLSGYIKESFYPNLNTRFFVDSGPVMEKDFAFTSGLGWIGKNSLFLSPEFGSYCLLGCLFVNLDIELDLINNFDLCGSCTACIEACPTQAINQDKTIKADKCISYLTTNRERTIPPDLRKKFGNQLFGCDVCQQICPINKVNQIRMKQKLAIIKPINNNEVDLLSELFLTENEFLIKYANTPIVKLPFEFFLRNLIIVIGNSGSKVFFKHLVQFLIKHPSPLIRLTAAWALSQINFQTCISLFSEALKEENNIEVRAELELIMKNNLGKE